jgi:acyl carrier protein
MDNKEKIALIEEMLDVEEGSLNAETRLDEIENWDSMAVISLIALVDEHFNKPLSASQIRKFKTIQDILDYME